MTELPQQAFDRASKLPESQQDEFARFLLAELDSERRWDELLSLTEPDDLLAVGRMTPWTHTKPAGRGPWI